MKTIFMVWWNNGLTYEDKREILLGVYDDEIKAIDTGFKYTKKVNNKRPADCLSHYYITKGYMNRPLTE